MLQNPIFDLSSQVLKTVSKDSTNNTLLFFQGRNKPTYFLPTYTRFKILGISNIQHIQMSSTLNAEFRISVKYTGINYQIKNTILEQGIRLCFEKDESMVLKRSDPNTQLYDDQSNQRFEFVIRKFINTKMDCKSIRWTPFETIECNVKLSLTKVVLLADHMKQILEAKGIGIQKKQPIQKLLMKNKYENIELQECYHQMKLLEGGSFQIHFNMMDNENLLNKMSISSKTEFGVFEAVLKSFTSHYTNKKEVIYSKQKGAKVSSNWKLEHKNEEKQNLNVRKRKQFGPNVPEAFKYAHFGIFLYKKPQVAMAAIFLPLFLLAVLNLGIFYQDNDLHKRIVSIGAILVSFVAFIPVIREQIPPTPKITAVQLLVMLQSFTTILALIDSITIKDLQEGFSHQNPFTVPYFIVSFILTVFVYLFALVLLLKYACHDLPKYKDKEYIWSSAAKPIGKKLKNQYKQLNPSEWSNDECDKYFEKDFNRKSIRVIQNSNDLVKIIKSTIEYGVIQRGQ